MTTTNTAQVTQNHKLLSIGRAWVNDRVNETGTSPKLTLKMDRNLGINITIGAGSQILLFANQKREGRRDADYRVAVSIPSEIADKEIARQQEALNVQRDSGVTVTEA